MRPRVSVVLPCFQAEATLPGCLESLFAQTYGDMEIVAVDDGSSDDTAAILQDFARRDSRLRVMLRPHRGFVATVNFALEVCRGELIARMDADDLCLPERFAAQVRFLDEHPHIGVVGCQVQFGGDPQAAAGYQAYVDWTNRLVEEEEIALGRFVESPFAHPSLMWRRPLARRWGAFLEGPFPEDYELLLRWMDNGVRMAKVPQTLLVWNDPPGRLSRTDPRYATEAFYALKAVYLARWIQRHVHLPVAVVGAGRLARRRAALLEAQGVRISRFWDVDPQKVGRIFAGKPVCSWFTLGGPGQEFLVSYVSGRGGRERVVAFLEERGWIVGRDYILAA